LGPRDTADVSEENLAAARELYARVNRRELPYDLISEESEFEQTSALLGTAGHYRGLDGGRRMLEELWEAFEEIRWEEIRMEAKDDKVVALMRVVSRGRESGVETEALVAHLWTIRDGIALRMETPGSLDAAYREAGIER
jgi:ketosteroid isomerase-like protein